jgi:hypothetical protein
MRRSRRKMEIKCIQARFGLEESDKHLSFKKAASFLFCRLIFHQLCNAVERAANAVRWFNTTRLHFLL